MTLRTLRSAVLTVLCLSMAPLAIADEGRYVSFLTCPIARDAGADADVCFVADYEGQRIALVNPPDWGAPQLHHQVLVEGQVKSELGICGAKKFEGRVSVMPEITQDCGTLLPSDGSFKGVAGGVFNAGSPAQRAHAVELAARVAADPSASVEPAILDVPPAPAPVPPYTSHELLILFPFNSTRGSGPDMGKLIELARYAHLSKAARVSVVGYRGSSKLSDGQMLTEPEPLARARAEKIAGIVARMGVDPKRLAVRWENSAVAGSGQDDWQNRKVEIHTSP